LKDFTRNLDFFFGGWWVSSVRRTQKNQKQNKKRVLKYKEKKKRATESRQLRDSKRWERGETEARHRERESKACAVVVGSVGEAKGGEGFLVLSGAAVAGWLQHCVWKTRIQRKKIWIALFIAAAAHHPQ
jgi:hypothetical protein